MNLPDSPLRLIRAGFFIGLGLALAYLVVAAVMFTLLALGSGMITGAEALFGSLPRWLRLDGALFALGLIVVAIILGLVAATYPFLRLRWTMLRHRWR